MAADIEAARHPVKVRGAYQMRLDARKLAFARFRISRDQRLGYQEPKMESPRNSSCSLSFSGEPGPAQISLARELCVSARRSNSGFESGIQLSLPKMPAPHASPGDYFLHRVRVDNGR